MAATVVLGEYHGAGETETVTPTLTNINFGYSTGTTADIANLDPATYPIPAGSNSFEKWLRLKATAQGGSTAINKFKVWSTGSPAANTYLKTNARESGYEGAQTYAQPSTTDRNATYDYKVDMPTSEPTAANFGYGGTLNANLTLASGLPKYSDYVIIQCQAGASATAGTSVTLNFQYDEVA